MFVTSFRSSACSTLPPVEVLSEDGFEVWPNVPVEDTFGLPRSFVFSTGLPM
jgi:hypothetical protein